jgi:hypothetical protein
MEVVVPLFALSSLYIINNQNKNKNESFVNKTKEIPNTDIPNRNYPDQNVISVETDLTSKLSTTNRFENGGGVFTDKYFNPDTVARTVLQNSANDTTPKPQSSYYSLTGEKVESNYFQHNNMVPFFGSNVRSNQKPGNSGESILDNYTGSGSQTITKKEIAPLFAPSENQQWAFGAPNNSDFFRSRVNPSMRMANVNPFEQEKVAPGLGLGYTNEGSGGFNSGMMMRDQWLDKNVDQLRVDNKPKPGGNMLYGHEGPADSMIKNISDSRHMGVLEKNRPERAFNMYNSEGMSDRLMTTTGIQKGETLRSVTIDRETGRQNNTTDYIGNAKSNNGGEYVTGEYMPAHTIELGRIPLAPANANGRNFAVEEDFEMRAKTAYPNNRSTNVQENYFGMVSGGLHAAVAPLLDVLRPSRKENSIGNLRPYQNPGTRVSQSYVFNPADKLPTTMRETTENSKFHVNVDRNQRGGAYEVTQHQPVNNARTETGDFYYSGNAGAGERTRQMKSYEAEYNQRNNDIKSATVDGRLVPGNMKLMNGDVNMRVATNRDNYLTNNRPISGSMRNPLTPDVNNMGKLHGSEELYQNIQLDRNNGDILTALKGNPYVVNYKNAL